MEYKALIFDFDGTLVDSMPCWSEKMLSILRSTRTEYPADIIRRIVTMGDLGTAHYFRDSLGVPLTIEEMLQKMDAYALPRYRDTIPLKPGVAEFLRQCRGAGFSLNILTASPHKMLDPCLDRLGIGALFDNVWSTDDLGLPKTDPKIYQEAAARLGIPVSDAVFFDDNINAIKTAALARMHTIGVFDESAEEDAPQMRLHADRYIRSFYELL